MVLYHAIKEVDESERPDSTAAELIRLIGLNCHTVLADSTLIDRYWHHINKLFGFPPLLTQASLFIADILANATKLIREESEPPEIPTAIKVPPEDIHIVRAALISRPLVVTTEKRLRKAINDQPLLGLQAMTPSEALRLAMQE